MRAALRVFRHPHWWLGLWIFGLVATVVVCLLPLPRVPMAVDHLDKLEHALGYALLMAWASMLFASRRALVWAAIGLVALGLGIEGLQALLPWRSASVADIAANALGVLIGGGVAFTPWAKTLQSLEARFFA